MAASQNVRNLYRKLCREISIFGLKRRTQNMAPGKKQAVGKSPTSLNDSAYHTQLREIFALRPCSDRAIKDGEGVVDFLRHQRQYETLLERHGGSSLSQLDRVRLSAQRVGLKVP